jgi:hypothetical protein
MKKLILTTILFTNLVFAQNVIIKSNNTIKSIPAKIDNDIYIVEKAIQYIKYFNADSNLIIKFNTIEPELINNFEESNMISNIKILANGEFIYSINNNEIISLLESLSNDTNVKSVTPIINTTINFH